MSLFKKVKKWIFRYKKRHYKVVYIATGVMGNKYDAGVFEFSVSDNELKSMHFNFYQYGFEKNYHLLKRHFRTYDGRIYYDAVRIINDK